MTIAELRAQLEAVEKAKPIVHTCERCAGKMSYFPDLDNLPEWLTGSLVSYPTEAQARDAAKDRKAFMIRHLEECIRIKQEAAE